MRKITGSFLVFVSVATVGLIAPAGLSHADPAPSSPRPVTPVSGETTEISPHHGPPILRIGASLINNLGHHNNDLHNVGDAVAHGIQQFVGEISQLH